MREGVPTVWDRYKSQQPQCKFGMTGVCCRLCHMGPCRITPKAGKGICGADVDTIVARNLLREIAAGTAAHSDHGRMLVKTLKLVAKGEGGSYKITDPRRLREVAAFFEIETEGRDDAGDRRRVGRFLHAAIRLVRGAECDAEDGPAETAGAVEEAGDRAARHRLRGGRDDAPHEHGRRPRLSPPDHGRAEDQPGGRLGRLAHRHRRAPTSSSARRNRCAAA